MRVLKSNMLRDYQSNIASRAIEALLHHDRIVVQSPTGSGKTYIAINGIIPRLIGSVAWVTHRIELIEQVKKYSSNIEAFMVQSGIIGEFDNVIIDEGHHVTSDQYRQILSMNNKSKVIALTATPYRLDGVGLGSCGFSKIVYGYDILKLTQLNVLCPVKVFVNATENSTSWNCEDCAAEIKKHTFKKCLVFCRSVHDAKITSKNLNKLGFKARYIHAETDAKERQEAIQQLKNGKINIICNHTILTEGVDIPEIDLIVLNRHTQSRALWMQMNGRGLRVHESKKFCKVLDLAGNAYTHGSIYDKEIYTLNGSIESTEPRTLNGINEKNAQEYEYKNKEELIEWKHKPKPIKIIENLHRQKLNSPLQRLRTGFQY